MKLSLPLLVALTDPEPRYRWRLVRSMYQSTQAIAEGAIALELVLAVCLARTGWWGYVALMLAVLAVVAVRLWDRRRFNLLAGSDQATPADAAGSPEVWARRYASCCCGSAAMWGITDLGVLLHSADQLLQLLALNIQAGWLASACMRSAASPASVLGLAACTLIPTEIGLLLTHHGFVQLLIPIAPVHFTALLRMGGSLGAQTARLLGAEQIVSRTNEQLAQANTQLLSQSMTDGMTGLANRRAFDAALVSEWSRAARSGGALALLMLDVDHFKRFNDHYGHLAGDDCLRDVAGRLAVSLSRPSDMTARYGGEEFVALLPGASEGDALIVAERIRCAVDRAAIPHETAPSGHVTVSVGVFSARPTLDKYPQILIRLADAALYEAKRRGRNQVFYGEASPGLDMESSEAA